MMATTDRDVCDGYLDAWNAHDPAAVARDMAEGAIYEDYNLAEMLAQLGIQPAAAPQ